MDISGVMVAEGVRLLVPDDGSTSRLFHRVSDDEWCETVVARRSLKGSFDAGDISTRKPIACSGGHLIGTLTDGLWSAEVVTDV